MDLMEKDRESCSIFFATCEIGQHFCAIILAHVWIEMQQAIKVVKEMLSWLELIFACFEYPTSGIIHAILQSAMPNMLDWAYDK